MTELRLALKAYVCEGGVTHWRHDEGTMTLNKIYVERPNGCRYAVAQAGDVFWVIDLYECQIEVGGFRIVSCEHRVLPDLDAAMMAARLTY